MPSNIHEMIIWKISTSIQSQLTTIVEKTSNKDTKRLMGEIRFGLCEPDQKLFIKGARHPGVVIEIAYSQSLEKLQRKVHDFIVRSCGQVQLAIGLETGSKKSFKISVWRPEFYRIKNKDAVRMKTITNRDIIRDSDGTLKPGCLRFHLQDFSNDLATKYPDADLTKEIALDYGALTEYLIDAEQCDDVPLSSVPDIIMSELSSSSEDEKKVHDLECRSAARSEASDPDCS